MMGKPQADEAEPVEMSDADDITEVVEFFALVPSAVAVAACATSGRDHWFYCKEHKVKWWGGSNLIRTEEPMTAAEVATTAAISRTLSRSRCTTRKRTRDE